MSFPIQPTEAVDSVARADIAAIELLTVALVAPTAGAGTKLVLKEPTGGGTSAVTIEGPALAANRAITLPDADVNLGDIATNAAAISAANTRTAGLIAPTTTVGGYLDLKEGTDNGAHRVRLTGPNSLAADRAVTFPDADVDLGLIATSVQTVAGLSPSGGDIAAGALNAALGTPVAATWAWAVAPADTVRQLWRVPWACTLSSVVAGTPEAAAPSAGTIAVRKCAAPGMDPAGGTNLLVAATFDLTTLVAKTPDSLDLTATTANLDLSAGDWLVVEVVNLAGSGIYAALTAVARSA